MANQKVTAEELAKTMREVSVAEFFEKNRHLLGYENPTKSLLTVVKEMVDNSLDACNEADILPEIKLSVKEISPDRFKVSVEDNGPGIVKDKVALAFGKLLYGSKFHRLRQSIAGDEKIVIKEGGIVKNISIGEFVDNLLKDGEEDVSHLGIKTLAFDPKDYKLKWCPLTNVIRHKPAEALYNLMTESGREVKVTGSHSVFVLDTETQTIKTKLTSEIKEGDYIVAAKSMPTNESNITEIRVLDYFKLATIKKNRWYVYGIQESVFNYLRKFGKKYIFKGRTYYRFKNFSLRSDHINIYQKLDMLPIQIVLSLELHKKFDIDNWKIKTYQVGGMPYEIPVKFKIDKDFVRFFGLWIAEGHIGNRRVVFDFGAHENKLINEIERISKKLFGRTAHRDFDLEKHKVRLIIDSTVLRELMVRMGFKTGASKKSIPEILFNIDKKLKVDFLKALYAGDGTFTKERTTLTYTTVSRSLASDLVLFLLSLGVLATIGKQRFKGLGKSFSNVFRINVFGRELNKLWFDVKTSRNSWPIYDGIPSELIKTLSRFKDLPKRMERERCLDFLRFRERRTNEQYMNILNTARQGRINFRNDFHFIQLVRGGMLHNVGGFGELTDEGMYFLDKIERLRRIINSDFLFLKVKKIERAKKRIKHVYDISVQGCENFVGGLGGIICHNSRGTQGIGVSGAILYSQLTTGKPTKLISSTGKETSEIELLIEVTKNEPKIASSKSTKNTEKNHGIKIEMEVEGRYVEGKQSIPEYLKQTAMMNPYAKIIYNGPNSKLEFQRATEELPRHPKEIKPHPYGVEIGILRRMIEATKARNIIGFLKSDFSRVGKTSAEQICKLAKIEFSKNPKNLSHEESERLHKAMQLAKLVAPPTDVLSPIGENLIIEGLKKELKAEHFVAVSRSPVVYRGMPFSIETGLAYGGELPQDQTAQFFRFANKVPLLYHQADCVTTEAIMETDFRRYGFSQPGNSLPVGPLAILIHFVSVWVPYTSEGKQAIANYPEIMKEIKLALQEAGRKLAIYVRQKAKQRERMLRRQIFERYSPVIAESLEKLTGKEKEAILKKLLSFTKTKPESKADEKEESEEK